MTMEHVYDVPAWHRALRREHVEADKTGRSALVAKAGDAKVAGFSGDFLDELFHRLYSLNPRKAKGPLTAASAVRSKLHKLASDLPEFETLRKQTVRDALWAGVAASTLAEKVVGALPARKTPPPDADRAGRRVDGLRNLRDENTDMNLDTQIDQAAKELQDAERATEAQAESVDETAIRHALRGAIRDASATIESMEESLDALGMGGGYGKGMGGGEVMRDPAEALRLCEQVKSDRKLKDIIELAGRLRAAGRAKRATKSEYARSELVGVEPTGDIERLMPSELGAFDDGDREMHLYLRLHEKSALGYQLRGRERETRGPVVIAIDQSDSMSGRSDTWAKAVALAVLDAAREQKRAFGIILYADGVRKATLFPEAGKADPGKVLDILSRNPRGGTSFDGAMTQALDWIGGSESQVPGKAGKQAQKAFKKADVINITDGDAGWGGDVMLKRADKLGARVYGIQIGSPYPTSCLKSWTHEAYGIAHLDQDDAMVDILGKL
jgi:uncharacterized protein with von Willebrand factor type A (vWA) domain